MCQYYDLSAAISTHYPHIISRYLNVKQKREFRTQFFCVFGGHCFCATQHFVPPLNNHVVPKKCPGMHTDSMQIFNKLQIEENNLIFSSPNFAVVCFRCQTWFHYLQLKAFKRSRSNNLNLKKEIISNAKPTQASLDQDTIQVYYNSGHSCNLFHLSDKKESRFFSPQKQSN